MTAIEARQRIPVPVDNSIPKLRPTRVAPHTRIVFDFVTEYGIASPAEISKRTGLSIVDARKGLRSLRNTKRVPRTTQDDRTALISEGKSALAESPVPQEARILANMGMAGREIKSALQIKGITVDYDGRDFSLKIRNRRSKVKGWRKLRKEEKENILKTCNPWFLDEDIDSRVSVWLSLAEALVADGSILPEDRMYWVARLAEEGVSMDPPKKEEETGISKGGVIFWGNRFVPSFKGRRHVEKSLQAIGEASVRNYNLPDETVREIASANSQVYNQVGPLAARGLIPSEIRGITRHTANPLSQRSIKHAFYAKRPAWHRIPFDIEKGDPSRRKRGQEKISEQVLGFLAHFYENGFFTFDFSRFLRLKGMFEDAHQEFPKDPMIGLQLEIYLVALDALTRGDPLLLNEYEDCAKQLDNEWLIQIKSNEQFLEIKTLASWADGEDRNGLYRLAPDGRKAYRMATDLYGESAYDTIKLIKYRMQR